MTSFAIVTGTSAGVGAEVAKQLVSRGWTVVGISRRSAAFGARYRHLSLDLGDIPAVARTIDAELVPLLRGGTWSRVGLVNNAAAAMLLGPLQNASAVDLLRSYAVSLAAPVSLMGAVSRHASMHVPLRIVNLSSGAATLALPGLAAYGSAKAGLRLAGMDLAAEWQSTVAHAPTRSDAAILSYEPHIVDTAMQEHARTRPRSDFPWVGMFEQFARDGRLVPPLLPADDIVAFLESKNQPAFAERRLQTT